MKWILIGIVLLGFALRIIGLSNHPAGFTPDEASFGYDSYSILKTGKDQWGNTMPLVFKSFGDDKLPVYTYLAVPSVAIFGLNEFAVRLPNAILGSLAVVVVYFLVKELFKGEKLALLSAFLIAISPWNVMLSRGAFEANLTTFFLPLAILLFLKSFENKKLLWLSFVIFIVNIFTYHTARILSPAILLSLIFIYKDKLKSEKLFNKTFIFSIILLLVSVTGVLFGGSRLTSSGIFDLGFANDRYLAQQVGEPNFISKIFYNKPIYISKQFFTNYFSYFSPQFLFTNGPAEGTYGMVPGVGVLYFVEIIFLIGFIWKLIKNNSKEINLFLFWILISPIPAALTKGPGYAANRAAFMMPAIEIILAIGGIFIYESLKKEWKKSFLVMSSILFFVNFIYVAEKYWVGETVNQSSAMIYGMDQVVKNINDKNQNIIISKSISEPQIYIAFYTKMDPSKYQNSSRNWNLVNGWVDQQGEYSLGKYTFRNLNYDVDKKLTNTILVGKPDEFQEKVAPTKEIVYPSRSEAYWIIND
ncbi:hypothetical protein BH10PAT1_BH10PAT1_1590 [soil metagenome]